ncbi:hypothetical protein QYM36_009919, partial [Artemia franciscana]
MSSTPMFDTKIGGNLEKKIVKNSEFDDLSEAIGEFSNLKEKIAPLNPALEWSENQTSKESFIETLEETQRNTYIEEGSESKLTTKSDKTLLTKTISRQLNEEIPFGREGTNQVEINIQDLVKNEKKNARKLLPEDLKQSPKRRKSDEDIVTIISPGESEHRPTPLSPRRISQCVQKKMTVYLEPLSSIRKESIQKPYPATVPTRRVSQRVPKKNTSFLESMISTKKKSPKRTCPAIVPLRRISQRVPKKKISFIEQTTSTKKQFPQKPCFTIAPPRGINRSPPEKKPSPIETMPSTEKQSPKKPCPTIVPPRRISHRIPEKKTNLVEPDALTKKQSPKKPCPAIVAPGRISQRNPKKKTSPIEPMASTRKQLPKRSYPIKCSSKSVQYKEELRENVQAI